MTSGDGEPGWHQFDSHALQTHIYDTTSRVVAYPEMAAREIWRSHEFGTCALR